MIRTFTNDFEKMEKSLKENPVLSNTNDIDYALSSSNVRSINPKNGGNRLIWDMRYPGFVSFEGMVFYSSPNTGPKVVPGKYDVVLTYNNDVFKEEFEIIKDPRVSVTDQDYKKQLDFYWQLETRFQKQIR